MQVGRLNDLQVSDDAHHDAGLVERPAMWGCQAKCSAILKHYTMSCSLLKSTCFQLSKRCLTHQSCNPQGAWPDRQAFTGLQKAPTGYLPHRPCCQEAVCECRLVFSSSAERKAPTKRSE